MNFQKTDNLAGQLNGLTKDQEALLRKLIPIHHKLANRIRNIYHNRIVITTNLIAYMSILILTLDGDYYIIRKIFALHRNILDVQLGQHDPK